MKTSSPEEFQRASASSRSYVSFSVFEWTQCARLLRKASNTGVLYLDRNMFSGSIPDVFQNLRHLGKSLSTKFLSAILH